MCIFRQNLTMPSYSASSLSQLNSKMHLQSLLGWELSCPVAMNLNTPNCATASYGMFFWYSPSTYFACLWPMSWPSKPFSVIRLDLCSINAAVYLLNYICTTSSIVIGSLKIQVIPDRWLWSCSRRYKCKSRCKKESHFQPDLGKGAFQRKKGGI